VPLHSWPDLPYVTFGKVPAPQKRPKNSKKRPKNSPSPLPTPMSTRAVLRDSYKHSCRRYNAFGRMQDYDFAKSNQIYPNLNHFCPNVSKFCPNLSKFFQIFPKFRPNFSEKTASPAPIALRTNIVVRLFSSRLNFVSFKQLTKIRRCPIQKLLPILFRPYFVLTQPYNSPLHAKKATN